MTVIVSLSGRTRGCSLVSDAFGQHAGRFACLLQTGVDAAPGVAFRRHERWGRKTDRSDFNANACAFPTADTKPSGTQALPCWMRSGSVSWRWRRPKMGRKGDGRSDQPFPGTPWMKINHQMAESHPPRRRFSAPSPASRSRRAPAPGAGTGGCGGRAGLRRGCVPRW